MKPASITMNTPLTRSGKRRALQTLVLACIVLSGGALRAHAPATQPGRLWSPEVADALSAYRTGEYDLAQQLCRQLLARPGDGRWRVDAAAIEALCLLRMPARADRVAGRTWLRQLWQEDATLLDEPECNLAYGIAQTALNETGEALDFLDRAATGFAEAGAPPRQAAALAAMAEAWSQHTEWQATPWRFKVTPPAGRDEANALRRCRIEALRPQIEALAGHEEALARYELVLGRFLIESGQAPADGWAVLERLASNAKLTAVAAEAAWQLAEHYESCAEWTRALALYERISREWHGALSRQAEQRWASIQRPQIVLDLPAAVASEQSAPIRLRVRGLNAVQLEVREADVEAWLGSARTRASEALLPESGAVHLACELPTAAPTLYDWWESAHADTEHSFRGTPGAYVVSARGLDRDGRLCTAKRLLTISDLKAALLVGSRHVLVWAGGPACEASAQQPITAKFWMNPSFAPTTVRLSDGWALFPLPGEARVFRDKGWVCLLRSGEHLAVSRGQLPSSADRTTGRQAVVLVGPPTPEVGQPIYIAGLLLPNEDGTLDLPASATAEIQLLDTVETLLFASEVPIGRGGGFATQVAVRPEWSGKHLRVIVRYRGQSLQNLGPRAVARVLPADAAPLLVQVGVPGWLPVGTAVLRGAVSAEYPWGTRPVRTPLDCTLTAARLPTLDDSLSQTRSFTVKDEAALDSRGQWSFVVPVAAFDLTPGPMMIKVAATVRGWEGRGAIGTGTVLLAPERPHAWLASDPPVQPTVGQEVRFHASWFDPDGVVVTGVSPIEIRRDGSRVAELCLHASPEGFTSQAWRPAEPGSYEAVTTLTGLDFFPRLLRKPLEVQVAEEAPTRQQLPPLCKASLTWVAGRPVVNVTLAGQPAGPLLVVVAAGGDPLAAQRIHRGATPVELTFPLQREPGPDLRVLVIDPGRGADEPLCCEPVAVGARPAADLQLTAPPASLWPGSTALLRVVCPHAPLREDGITLTAWLTDAARVPPLDRTVEEQEAGRQQYGRGELPAILRQGAVLWCTSLTVRQAETDLTVPMPAKAGLYRLLVLHCGSLGEIVTADSVLDTRRGVRLRLDLPPRLTLGDRTLLAACVENDCPTAVEVRLRCTAQAGLLLEALRIEIPGMAAVSCQSGALVEVTLPPRQRAWLRGQVEAAAVGSAQVEVEVAALGMEQAVRKACEVLDDPALAAPSALTVRRSIAVRTETGQAAGNPDDDEHVARWTWAALAPGALLEPGQYLRVREEFTLATPLPAMMWSQRLPATCLSATRLSSRDAPIGRRRPARADEVSYEVGPLAPGPHTHEYYLAVVRPGTCLLPAPELRAGEAAIPARAEPAALRITVSDE